MTNITHLAAQRYASDQSKQQDLLQQVAAALDQEEMSYRRIRRSIMRKTLKKKKQLTKEELELQQKMDYEHDLFRITHGDSSQVEAVSLDHALATQEKHATNTSATKLLR